MTKDLTKLSADALRNEWYELQMDSQYYQDRQFDHGEDHADTLDSIDALMEDISKEERRRDELNAIEVAAAEFAYDRMVEA